MSKLTFEKIKAILKGIEETETESEFGWWETTEGAALGKRKLLEIEALIGKDSE